jgi:hypothetical protein
MGGKFFRLTNELLRDRDRNRVGFANLRALNLGQKLTYRVFLGNPVVVSSKRCPEMRSNGKIGRHPLPRSVEGDCREIVDQAIAQSFASGYFLKGRHFTDFP